MKTGLKINVDLGEEKMSVSIEAEGKEIIKHTLYLLRLFRDLGETKKVD